MFCSLRVFVSHEATDRQWEHRADVHISAWFALFDWFEQCVYRVSLSCPARLIPTEAPRERQENECPLKSPLCCVFMCYALYSSCMIATRLPRTFSSLSCPGIKNIYRSFLLFFFFQSIVSLKWDSVVSLWFGSVLCLTYSPFFCYACSCCCPGSGCLWGCHGGGCFVATELSILTRMLMRSG